MFIGVGLNLVRGGGSASPASLFAASEPGAWYDPSDLTTLFQDSAGVTPVTAPNQTVGKVLDKSGRGNHATQATLAQRPTYGINPIIGTRNLSVYSEELNNAIWTKGEVTVTSNAATAPDGTSTADAVIPSTVSTASHQTYQAVSGLTVGPNYVFSLYAKAFGYNFIRINIDSFYAFFNVSTGVVGVNSGGASSSTIQSVGNGWYRCSLIAPVAAASTNMVIKVQTADSQFSAFAGDGTSGVYIWGTQFEKASASTAYQKVVTQYEVTEAGIASASYIAFDGVDDGMVTGTITPGIDKVQVFAGIRRISDASTGILAEFSPGLGANAGSWNMRSPAGGGTATSGFTSKGTVSAVNDTASPAAPITEVLTGIGDISGDTNIFRKNSVPTSILTDQGTGDFLPYVLYIGRRNGVSLPLNHFIYSLIVRFGANLTAGQITATEAYVNGRTGAY